MGTYSYAVLRFVPDPIRNEPVNVGVVVVDPETGRTAHALMRNLRALGRRCPGADLGSLESVLESFHVGDMPGGADDLASLARRHTNLLQFTPPRAVAAPTMEESLELAFERYVGVHAVCSGAPRPKSPRALMLCEIDAALAGAGVAAGAVEKRPVFAGRRGAFTPDWGVFGGGRALALHAISFMARGSFAFSLNAAKVLAVDFEDARAKDGGLECTVVAEPPPDATREEIGPYAQAAGHLEDRGCRVIRLSGMESLAKEVGRRLGRLDRKGRKALRAP